MSASSTITCPRCGERLPAGFTRCDACGAYLVPAPGALQASGRGSHDPRHRGSGAGARRQSASGASPSWLYLAIGLLVGGAIGYALHSAVGPRTDGGAPTGPSDILAGNTGSAGGGMDGGGMSGGGMGSPPPGAQMPPEISAQVQRYRQALMMDPKDLAANIGLGNLLFDSGQWEKAIDHYSTALERDPKNADVRVDRAIAYHSMNQDAKAKDELLAVTKSHPEHRNAWLNLGVVSANMGDKATAVRAWEQFLKLEPNGTHSAAIRDELQRLKNS
ncbi:MAG TPA: tetratricopeptide repeat protein [Candidatus Eisenbacteria bacterium]|nr:tetratricopeptide repeat protein [Candidatus Eisenbacteria bacterium]